MGLSFFRGKGCRREMVWLELKQSMGRSGRVGEQFKGYGWQAKDVGSEASEKWGQDAT